jgi:hypothetical protein
MAGRTTSTYSIRLRDTLWQSQPRHCLMRDPGGPHVTVLGGSKPHQLVVAVERGETPSCHPLRRTRSLILATPLLAAIQSSEFLGGERLRMLGLLRRLRSRAPHPSARSSRRALPSSRTASLSRWCRRKPVHRKHLAPVSLSLQSMRQHSQRFCSLSIFRLLLTDKSPNPLLLSTGWIVDS